MASGLDVDTLVKQMMSAETAKVDKVKQARQQLQWKQDIFRDLIGELNTFKNTYFNVAKSDTYILSQNNYTSYEVKSTDTTNAITVTAQSKAIAGSYKISVGQLAEKALYTSATRVNTAVAGSSITFPIKIDTTNNELTVDGKTITLTEGGYSSLTALASHINSKISADDTLKNTVKAVVKNNEIQFAHTVQVFDEGTDKNNEINITTGSSTFKVTLTKGYYTLDEMAAQINNQLKTAKDADGNGIPTDFKAEVASDMKSIIYKNTDGSITGTADKNFSISSLAAVGSTGTVTTTGTKPIADGTSDKLSYIKDIIPGFNDTIQMKVGTSTYEIKLNTEKDYNTMDADALADDFVSQINTGISALTDSNGNPVDIDVQVEKTSDNKLRFISTSTNQVYISGNAANMIGVSSGFQINQNLDDSITNFFSGKAKFTVNGKEFSYDFSSTTDNGTVIGARNKTLSDILDDISIKANVDISYSQLTRNFTLTSKTTGADQIIVDTKDIIDSEYTENFLGTLFGETTISDASGNLSKTDEFGNPIKLQGKDAIVTITEPNSSATTTYQSSNNFTIDGVSYTLNEKPASDVTLTLVPNASSSLEKIKSFINKYNEIIEKINDKLIEKKQYDYLPLTDEQKEAMKEADITKWEEKAKQGLIRGDSTLENALYNIRKAFYDSVKVTFSDPQMSSIGISLKDVGMSTSADTTQRGKIIIDEEKLKNALQNDGDKVAKLFTKVSSTVPYYSRNLTNAERNQRYSEEGIFQRIKDVLEDNLSTMRDSKGLKGALLEKAGIKGDYSEYHNFLTDELDRKDKLITSLNKKLTEKEEYYYTKFSKLETAMSQLNSQQSWFSQQISAMGGY